jgi:hypothetical protein
MLIRNARYVQLLLCLKKDYPFVSVVLSSRKFSTLRSIGVSVPENSFCGSVVFLLYYNVQFLCVLFTIMFIEPSIML